MSIKFENNFYKCECRTVVRLLESSYIMHVWIALQCVAAIQIGIHYTNGGEWRT